MSKPSTRTDWHEAIFCAVQIDLREYSHLLEYTKEYYLSDNKNRIDMLVIKKQAEFKIPKHIASIFRTHNIFETKGYNTSLSLNAYYKTNAHAGYYINSFSGKNAIDRRDITLTFPAFRYPRKLFSHLTKECNKTIEKAFPGVYYILNDMYATQVLVLKELLPKDSLYLHCLKKNMNDLNLIDTLTKEYTLNKDNKLYTSYMNQLLGFHKKGANFMVCENLFRLYGTSSEEIRSQAAEEAIKKTREQAENYYQPQIDKLTNSVNTLTSENQVLKQLLAKHNIAYW